jgi:hypothetical protein
MPLVQTSLIKPSAVTQFSAVCEVLGLPLYLWLIIQGRSAIFEFTAPQTLPFWLKMLQKSYQQADLKHGIIFNHTGHFVRL